MVSGSIQCRSRYSYLHKDIITCFNSGSLIRPCTHTEGPRSPSAICTISFNHRVFRPFAGDCHPLYQTIVPRRRPLSLVPDSRPSSLNVVPRPGLSFLVLDRRPLSRTVVPRPSTPFSIFTLEPVVDALDS